MKKVGNGFTKGGLVSEKIAILSSFTPKILRENQSRRINSNFLKKKKKKTELTN